MNETTSSTNGLIPLLGTLGTAAFFLLAAYGLGSGLFPAAPYVPPPKPLSDYDGKALVESITASKIEATQKTILNFGSRLPGQNGYDKTVDYVTSRLSDAGYEVLTQPFKGVSPLLEHTRFSVLDSSGSLIDQAVELFPVFPNYLTPTTTPEGGVTGELVAITTDLIRNAQSLSGKIGVLDAAPNAFVPDYGFNVIRYAQLGLKALIITDSRGLNSADWDAILDRFEGVVSSGPLPFPRLAAEPSILEYIGTTVNVDVVSRFERVDAVNLVAVLRAEEPVEDVTVISGNLDAHAGLPDQAHSAVLTSGLAANIEIAEQLAAYRSFLRSDIWFVFTTGAFNCQDGLDRLLRLLRVNQRVLDERRQNPTNPQYRTSFVAEDLEEHESALANVQRVLKVISNDDFFAEPKPTLGAINAFDKEPRALFEEQFEYVLRTLSFEIVDPLLNAQIALDAQPNADVEDPLFQAYLKLKAASNRSSSIISLSMSNILDNQRDYLEENQVKTRMIQRFQELETHHAFHVAAYQEEMKLAQAADGYENWIVLHPIFLPTSQPDATSTRLATLVKEERDTLSKQVAVLGKSLASDLLGDKAPQILDPSRETTRIIRNLMDNAADMTVHMWNGKGYGAVGFVTVDHIDGMKNRPNPGYLPWMLEAESIISPVRTLAITALDIATGTLRGVPVENSNYRIYNFVGRILADGVGQSLVASYPLAGATVFSRPKEQYGTASTTGMYYQGGLEMADPYGVWQREETISDFHMNWRFSGEGSNFVATAYDHRGQIKYIKNEGPDGQRLFKSMNIPRTARESLANQTIVTFRASPISIVQLNNPQSMKDYNGILPVDAEGLTPFPRFIGFSSLGAEIFFIPPEEQFFLQLQAGDPGNDLVRNTRAFLLNVEESKTLDESKDIDGVGYLARDNPIILDTALRAAHSMVSVNEKRLDLQNAYSMADERTNTNHELAIEALEAAQEPGITQIEREKRARDSVIFSTLNHPVIRDNIFEAVVGILWYLFLLVPFVFFFEKLLFSYADIRKQVIAQSMIFLIVFILLRILHPAFQMVQSSLMILLGFIIIMISTGITVLFSSKFSENLEDLRKKQGKVSAAEVNKLGVMVSAFMLGLNNMNRRKVRTGLTCGTLTLLTFVMISFTSVQNNLVEEDIAIGKAPYQGMLVKRDSFMPLSNQEVFAFQKKFSEDYQVSPRRMLVGREEKGYVQNPIVQLNVMDDSGRVREADAQSIVMFDLEDPIQHHLPFITPKTWFEPQDFIEGTFPVMVSQDAADSLAISSEDVVEGKAQITINGVNVRIIALFDGKALNTLTDLDSVNVLPFDIEAMSSVTVAETGGNRYIVASDEDPRIDGNNIVIAPLRNLPMSVAFGDEIVSSLVVSMPDTPFREARETIESFMIQTGEPLYYGLDGNAYRGERSRKVSLSGLVDLIIPLLIAGMTVLNTMKGSVYERRTEIYVYNAVGIAPRYVFFMFIAEALVYAVVGSMIGYLASQGTGRILTELDLTGGLNMSYTSMATIYASLTIMVAVIVSTYFPATQAMEIAAPAEESGWKLPEPQGNDLVFDLPFNFNQTERLAVLEFFNRYLLERGEGSSGSFYSAVPNLSIQEDYVEGQPVPQLSTTIWLKPFDLAVSQTMTLETPFDPETQEFKARMILTRLSGTNESWLRLNSKYVSDLRRHFLHWRAVPAHDREEIFEEARNRIRIGMAEMTPA